MQFSTLVAATFLVATVQADFTVTITTTVPPPASSLITTLLKPKAVYHNKQAEDPDIVETTLPTTIGIEPSSIAEATTFSNSSVTYSEPETFSSIYETTAFTEPATTFQPTTLTEETPTSSGEEPTSTWNSPLKDWADKLRDRLTDFIHNADERFKKIITDIHNFRRQWEDDRKNLKWNERLEKYANEILDRIKCDIHKLLDPDLEFDRAINTADYGINVATGYDNLRDAVDSWYQKGKPGQNKRIFRRDGLAASNYNQMLAVDASNVGCAVRKCGGESVLLCAYDKKA